MNILGRSIDITKLKARMRDIPNRSRKFFRGKFLADEDTNNTITKKKQKWLLILMLLGVVIVLYLLAEGAEAKKAEVGEAEVNQNDIGFNLDGLSDIDPGDRWAKDAKRNMEVMRQDQGESNRKLAVTTEELVKQKESQDELKQQFGNELIKLRNEIEALRQIRSKKVEIEREELKQSMHVYQKPEKRIKKISEYIPAGSYVPAKMISGVDVSVGISSGGDPRQALLRVVGEVVSTGYGDKYLKNEKLIGCVIQAQATGDLSSEKAYLKPVIMTCARDEERVIEIPVKGYITSSGKVGIRGEIVSREIDFVTKSFLAGMIGGIGQGLADMSQPSTALTSTGFALTAKQSTKELAGAGLGQGISNSSSMLSNYFIKRAEQYQPVISINEGTDVTVVFQEGFKIEDFDDE